MTAINYQEALDSNVLMEVLEILGGSQTSKSKTSAGTLSPLTPSCDLLWKTTTAILASPTLLSTLERVS